MVKLRNGFGIERRMSMSTSGSITSYCRSLPRIRFGDDGGKVARDDDGDVGDGVEINDENDDSDDNDDDGDDEDDDDDDDGIGIVVFRETCDFLLDSSNARIEIWLLIDLGKLCRNLVICCDFRFSW